MPSAAAGAAIRTERLNRFTRVYGGAHLSSRPDHRRRASVRRDTRCAPLRDGARARRYAPDARRGWSGSACRRPAERVHARVREKLQREPVEDFRLDFEDGYGNRPDAEEDGHAASAAVEVAAGAKQRHAAAVHRHPHQEPRRRAARARAADDAPVPRAAAAGNRRHAAAELRRHAAEDHAQRTQVGALVDAFAQIETVAPARARHAADGADGRDAAVDLRRARRRRAAGAGARKGAGAIVAAHFGTYDYTASLGITAAHQHMRHPACDFARSVMQVALAGTDVWLSDGATNVLPVGNDRAAIHRAWRLHYDDIRHSLDQRVLPGLGPASRAARHALRRRLRVLPREPRRGVGAPAQLHRQGRAGHARRRRVRRRGDRARAC